MCAWRQCAHKLSVILKLMTMVTGLGMRLHAQTRKWRPSTRQKKVFLPKSSTCRDGTKLDRNNTTTHPHHPYILRRFANFAHYKGLCTLVYAHPIHNPHFTHTVTQHSTVGSLRFTLPLWGSLRFILPLWGSLTFKLPLWGSLTFTLPLWGSLTLTFWVWGSLTLQLPLWGSSV